MAIQNVRMQQKRGEEVNFDPDKILPGEFALSTDQKIIRIGISPGVCIRLATYDAFETDMAKIQSILEEAQTIEDAVNKIYQELQGVVVDVERVELAAQIATEKAEEASISADNAYDDSVIAQNKALEASESAEIASTKAVEAKTASGNAILKANEAYESAQSASVNAENSETYANTSISYAIGGTGERLGEDVDNSKYYSEQAKKDADRAEEAAEKAESISDIGIMTVEKAGIGKPDGKTITVDPDGTMHSVGGGTSGTTNYEDLENKPSIGGITLSGNKTLSELGIQPKGNYLEQESDPTVPEWAKSPSKPTYTASEIGADERGSASTALASAKNYTDSKIADLVGGAPSTLDTLIEISDALEESGEAVEAINQAIGNKLEKTGDSKDNTVTFTQASTRTNISSTEKHSTLFGKIAKWFADLKTVAFTGSYNDLNNKPTIPTVNNATLTIQRNGSNVQTFTANASSNKTANIIVPTKTSELTNDSGFLSSTTALDTYEEIMANTQSGKFAGALGVKEGFETVNQSLQNLNIGKWTFLGTGTSVSIPSDVLEKANEFYVHAVHTTNTIYVQDVCILKDVMSDNQVNIILGGYCKYTTQYFSLGYSKTSIKSDVWYLDSTMINGFEITVYYR